MIKKVILFSMLVLFSIGNIASAQNEAMTQEQFAVKLVHSMKLYDRLPLTALPSDCVELLESLGISPLKRWDGKALLTEEDYTVIVAKAVGKESVVHEKSVELCNRNIDKLNRLLKKNPNLSLKELLADKSILPEGSPQCPYGLKYKDKHNKHAVDPHYHPVALYE